MHDGLNIAGIGKLHSICNVIIATHAITLLDNINSLSSLIDWKKHIVNFLYTIEYTSNYLLYFYRCYSKLTYEIKENYS